MLLIFDLPLAAVLDVFRGAVMVLFIASALLVSIVVLLQEGKGGGLAGAFGGAGAETFGVKAGTVNRFTAWLAAAFLGLALLHAGLSTATKGPKKAVDTTPFEAPAPGGDALDPEATGQPSAPVAPGGEAPGGGAPGGEAPGGGNGAPPGDK